MNSSCQTSWKAAEHLFLRKSFSLEKERARRSRSLIIIAAAAKPLKENTFRPITVRRIICLSVMSGNISTRWILYSPIFLSSILIFFLCQWLICTSLLNVERNSAWLKWWSPRFCLARCYVAVKPSKKVKIKKCFWDPMCWHTALCLHTSHRHTHTHPCIKTCVSGVIFEALIHRWWCCLHMPSSGTAVCTCACVCVFRSPTLERDLSASLSELPLSSINLSLSFCHLSLSLYPLFPPLNSRQLFLSLFTSSLLRSCSLFSHFVDFFINLRRLHFLYINTVTIDLI